MPAGDDTSLRTREGADGTWGVINSTKDGAAVDANHVPLRPYFKSLYSLVPTTLPIILQFTNMHRSCAPLVLDCLLLCEAACPHTRKHLVSLDSKVALKGEKSQAT